MKPALPTPCKACPWRLSNQGIRHPGGWYTKKNLARLWAGMRRGERMTCHPTDQTNPLPPGFDPVPDHVEVHECGGSLILKGREYMRAQAVILRTGRMTEYNRANSRGVTDEGMMRMIVAELPAPFGTVTDDCPAPRKMNLVDDEIGYEAAPIMTEAEATDLASAVPDPLRVTG